MGLIFMEGYIQRTRNMYVCSPDDNCQEHILPPLFHTIFWFSWYATSLYSLTPNESIWLSESEIIIYILINDVKMAFFAPHVQHSLLDGNVQMLQFGFFFCDTNYHCNSLCYVVTFQEVIERLLHWSIALAILDFQQHSNGIQAPTSHTNT